MTTPEPPPWPPWAKMATTVGLIFSMTVMRLASAASIALARSSAQPRGAVAIVRESRPAARIPRNAKKRGEFLRDMIGPSAVRNRQDACIHLTLLAQLGIGEIDMVAQVKQARRTDDDAKLFDAFHRE